MKVQSYLAICISLFIYSCESNDGNSTQNYPIHVIDGISGESMPNAKVSLSWNLASQNLDFVEGITDQNGMIELRTSVDIDSVDLFIANDEWARPDWKHQNIWVDIEGYSYYELVQDTAIQIIRSHLETGVPITAKVYENVPFKFSMIDVPPLRDRSMLIFADFNQFHPAFSFDYTGFSLHVFELESMDNKQSIDTNIANGVDYRIDFVLAQFDTLTETIDTLSVTPIEFKGDRNLPNQEIVFEF